jgi:hypothetical protein
MPEQITQPDTTETHPEAPGTPPPAESGPSPRPPANGERLVRVEVKLEVLTEKVDKLSASLIDTAVAVGRLEAKIDSLEKNQNDKIDRLEQGLKAEFGTKIDKVEQVLTEKIVGLERN